MKNLLLAKVIELEPLEGVGPLGEGTTEPLNTLELVLSRVIAIMTAIGVLIFVFQFILAGYNWITASGDSQKVEAAQQKMINAFIGIAVTILAVAMVALVGYLLGGVDLLNLQEAFGKLE